MRATKKTLMALIAALAACIAATVLLTFGGTGESAADRTATYYFTNYAAPEELMLASVENDTGSVVLAAANGSYYAAGDVALTPDEAEVAYFFDTVYRLPMKRLLEGANASDPQYGLTAPRAEILLQDTAQNGVLFRLGSATPDGVGCYACLSGDDRVFVMERAYAQLFLTTVNRFYDLSLYPAVDGRLRMVTVQRNGAPVYSLSALTQDGSAFAMTVPYPIALGISQMKNEVLTPLRELEGVEVIAQPEDLTAYGLADRTNCFALTYDDGSSAIIRVGRQEGVGTYVMAEESGTVMLVPTANLSFFHASALQIVGQNLISVSLGDLKGLQIGEHLYRVSGTAPALTVTRDGAETALEDFQNGVFTALNRISIQEAWSGEEQGELLTEVAVQTGTSTGRYAFYALDGRRCGVAVNGQPAFRCSRTAVQQLMDAAG